LFFKLFDFEFCSDFEIYIPILYFHNRHGSLNGPSPYVPVPRACQSGDKLPLRLKRQIGVHLLIALSGDPDRFRLGNRRCQTIMGLAHVTYVRRECLPSFVVIGGLLPSSKKRKLVRCCLLVTIFLFLTIFSFLFLIWFE
jgi:hypothetical protein